MMWNECKPSQLQYVLKDVNRWDDVKIDLYISVNAAY